MKLKIGEKTFIKDIQHEFSICYPFLKIEFFKKGHVEDSLSPKSEKIVPGENAISFFITHIPGAIDIDSKKTVAQIESEFQERFGLSVQVYRKSGNLWLETSKTDDWSLGRQNEEGKNSESGAGKKTFDEKLEDSRWDSE